jgi:uncharacterized tellurite resistance protein B-like protein
MSYSDLYSSGKHKEEIGHFANIVKIAKADGDICELEEALIINAGKRLNITAEESIVILNNPEKFPINSPVSYEERIERLFRLTRMLLVDGEEDLREVNLLQKIAIGLNFKSRNIEIVCKESIHLVKQDIDLDTFITEIKKIDK